MTDVIQADRDLAAQIMSMAERHLIQTAKVVQGDTRGGLNDGYWIVQMLARHRLASRPTPAGAAMRTAANTDPVELARIQLLADVELHLQSIRVFVTSREKAHPCGVDLHDELLARVTAAINDGGARG